ncbi:hypothetical protein, partial [Vibrio parahaemolyticus]|uniref:hypothetical protein n=1 Tax=Vibrio parahaemolyticus TaxID=670 RepID=UPI001A8FDFC5
DLSETLNVRVICSFLNRFMLHVDPDIRRAHTLPGNFYSDPEYFERTKIEIFVRSWQMAAGPECGKGITPFTLLPELLGEELII